MDIVQMFLKAKGSSVTDSLVGKLGFEPAQATGFLGTAVKKIMELVSGGGLSVTDLMGGGGVSALMSKLDIGALASSTGVAQDAAENGVRELAPSLIGFMKESADSPDALLGMLKGGGGIMGKLGGMLGG
ncbi:MAG: hypothetical protein GXP29_02860 [Planctomycetes bacterium]|nr:hypothetical protein [Planctomycetota bacterium]